MIHLYIGPGMDGGIIAVVFGVLLSFLLAIFALVWYPIKKLFYKLKALFIPINKDNELLQ